MKALFTGVGIGLTLLLGWLVLSGTGKPGGAAEGQQAPPATVESQPPEAEGRGQYITPPDLTGPFDFAGRPLPMDNFDVRERLDLELMRNAYFHRNTLLLLKRAGRYFPTIDRILAEEGLPADLRYLAAAESALTEAVSPAGARGVWQFMAPTGRAYGLEINAEVDERYHLEKATRAAAAYLRDYYREFGDWHKVAAAYNMGGPNLRKWLDRQRADDLFDLDINGETMQYLFRIVAIKTIMEDPQGFGYHLKPEERYAQLGETREVTVSRSIPNLGDFAREQGITYRMLKLYNPWLVSGSLSVRSGNAYQLRIPR